MAKIISRPKDEDKALQTVRLILEHYSQGTLTAPAISLNTHDEVMSALEIFVATAIATARAVAAQNQALAHDLLVTTINLDLMESRLESISEVVEDLINVGYDASLDHAAEDLMDGLVSAGVAEPNSNGELAFDSRVLMSKADLKPILREAVQRWVEMKVR